jgi:hypothetical protein
MRALLAVLLLAGCDTTFGLDTVKVSDATVDAFLPEHAVAYLPLDELVRGGTPDSGGQLATCTECPRKTTGRIGGAMEFSATNQLFKLEPRFNLETTAGFTAAFWIRLEAYPETSLSCAVQKVYGTAKLNSWQFCVDAGHLAHYILTSSSGEQDLLGPEVPLDTWHHIALVWDPPDNMRATLYLDGEVTSAQASTDIQYDGGSVTIGADIDDGAPILAPMGLIDDVRIYDVALTTNEIRMLASPPGP